MKNALLALVLLLASACSNNGPNPIAVSSTYGCYSGWDGRTVCQATFADGDTGYVIKDYYQGAAYACRRGGLY